jgi:hypothetical protein
VGINANLPRFDYDPVTLACKGLLIEESRTNLLLRSESFGTSPWVGTGITSDQITSPDGNNTADLGTFTGGVNDLLYQTVTVTASTTYTFTCYVKLGSMAAGDYKVAFYNNTAASFIVTGAVPAEPLSNSVWTRISYSVTTPAGCTSMRVYAFRNSSVPANSTVYFWGAQLEAGAFATSYIPTVASQVTRNADVATMTGTNFSDWYNATQGTFVTQAMSPSTFVPAHADNGTAGVSISTRSRASGVSGTAASVANISEQLTATNFTFAATNKVALAFKENDFAWSLNGATPATDTSGTLPTVDRMRFGSNVTSTFSGHLQKVFFYPQRLTTAEVQAFSK